MDYSFNYKLPEGLQARQSPEKLVGTGQVRQPALENRTNGNPVASQAKVGPIEALRDRAGKLKYVALGGVILGGSLAFGWYIYANGSAASAPAAQLTGATMQPPRPVLPPASAAAQPNVAQPQAVQQVSALAAELPATPQPIAPSSAQPVASHQQAFPTQPGQYHQPAAHPTPAAVAPSVQAAPAPVPQPPQRAIPRDDVYPEEVEPERPRRRWRSQRSEATSEQRTSSRSTPEGREKTKASDRERLF